jgi:starvation-inducible outer membrane lipoprotein
MEKWLRGSLFLLVLSLGACYGGMFPSTVVQDVDSSVQFQALQAQPDTYRGRVVQLSGRIIDIDTVEYGTVISLRHLPSLLLGHRLAMTQYSKQTFTVFYPGTMDSAALDLWDNVVVIGTVQGNQSMRQPYVLARCLHVSKRGRDEITDNSDRLYPVPFEKTYCRQSS